MQIPFARPHLTGEGEGAAVADVIASGWVPRAPASPSSRGRSPSAWARRRRSRRRAARRRCISRSMSRRRPGDEVVVPSLSFIATANAVRHCGADAGVRRRRPADLQPRPRRRRAGDHRRARRRSCRCTSSACRPTWTRSSSSAERHGARRSSRTRPARSAPVQGPADRLARPARLLLAAPAQGDHHRRGRHDRRPRPERRRPAAAGCASTRMDVSDLARHTAATSSSSATPSAAGTTA